MMFSIVVLSALAAAVSGKWNPEEAWCKTAQLCDNDVQPLGCFEQGPKTPWCHMAYLPDPVAKIAPKFYLQKPNGQRTEFSFADLKLQKLGPLDPSADFFVVIHGFGGGFPQVWLNPVADALSAQGNFVILIDWTGGSSTINYLKAAANTRVTGAAVARVVNEFKRQRGISPKRFTLVGFSLGAHVAGFAGARIPGLRRIIGLDPAGPLYANMDPFYMGMNSVSRLNQSDAELVVCIHTDGTLLVEGGAGTTQSFGHIDFLANGGQLQPGCAVPVPQPPMGQALEDLEHFNWGAVMNDFLCPHERSDFYFLSSILGSVEGGCRFEAFPCTSADDWLNSRCTECGEGGCPVAGIETDVGTTQRGRFFFSTKWSNDTKSMFCGKQFHLEFTTSTEICGELSFQFGGSEWISDKTTFSLSSDGDTQERVIVLDFEETPEFVQVSYVPHSWISAWWFHFSKLQITLMGNNRQSYKVPASALSAKVGAIWNSWGKPTLFVL